MVATATITSSVNAIEPNKRISNAKSSGYTKAQDNNINIVDTTNSQLSDIQNLMLQYKNVSNNESQIAQEKYIIDQLQLMDADAIKKSIIDNARNLSVQGNISVVGQITSNPKSMNNALSITPYRANTWRVTTSNMWANGTSSWGLAAFTAADSLIDTSSNYVGQDADIAGGGVGGISGWGYVGLYFIWNGPTETVNIAMNGAYNGYLYAGGTTSASATIDLQIVDDTTGGTLVDSINIINPSVSAPADYDPEQGSINHAINPYLINGHKYIVYVKISCTAGIAGAGAGGANFWGSPRGANYQTLTFTYN